MAKHVCTYCGLPKKLDGDHVLAQCLFVDKSNERSIKVKSCRDCNGKSDEGLLKAFMSFLDPRIYEKSIGHFKHAKGAGDVRKLLSIGFDTGSEFSFYPDAKITKLFKKWFMGLRRHLMREKWSFVKPDKFLLATIIKQDDTYKAGFLPLKVGGPNPFCVLPSEANSVIETFDQKFRDFSFGIKEEDEDKLVMGLKYERNDYEQYGNRLLLYCWVNCH